MNTIELLRDLVAIPSVNPMGRAVTGPEFLEGRLTDYLEGFFRKVGVPAERQIICAERENIVARCEIPSARRTILLEAHQDTVPIDKMTIAPFEARIEGGRMYGRGACDIKGGMAAMLTAFVRLFREKPRGAANVIMACAVDEEFTSLGVRKLVEKGIRADAAIVAEPTQLDIVHAHKGISRWHLTVPGRACHSSSPQLGTNAIYRMGRILVAVERFAQQLAASRPDPLLGSPTLSVGRIEGGASVNTVPDFCKIEIDRRVVPGEDPLEAPTQLSQFLKTEGAINFPFECATPWSHKQPLDPEQSKDLVTRFGKVIDTVRGTHRVTPVPYGTDASTLADAGIPSIVFGPGDIARAHTCDEWVELDEVEQASEILYRFIRAE
jgi:acetylornithine deacetylase